MDLIELIESYIVYLITECDLSVSLHPQGKETLITFSRLMRFNIHDNSYCTYIKSYPEARKKCLIQQKKVFKKCTDLMDCFCGVCHAGVFEYVYPISNGESITGFISISGYCCEKGMKKLDTVVNDFGYSGETLSKRYSSLRAPIVHKRKLDTLVLPLVKMLELAYKNEDKPSSENSRITSICRYIRQNYASDITTEEICKEFYCSRSHFSHTFKKETGESFREYLIGVRLEHAKRLLKYSNLNVTEIALSVGFKDANYFSNVFKKRICVSPMTYRKT